MNKSVEKKDYFEYLKKRSMPGLFYHNYYLYPRLNYALHGNVLDFGCGIGEFLKFRPNTIGVDINAFNIDYCKSLGLKAELMEEGGSIPFEDDSFSGVVMDNVLEHIPQEGVKHVLQEISRVLQQGGIFIIGVPGKKGYDSDDDHKHFYSEEDLISLLVEYKWIRKKILHMPFYLTGIEKYLRQYCVYAFFEKYQHVQD